MELSSATADFGVFELKWSDLNGDSLHVSRTLSQTVQGIELKTPKVKKSNRTIALFQVAVDVLKRHHVEQSKTKLVMGLGYRNKGLIFARENGPLETYEFRRYVCPPVRDAELWKLRPELKQFRFHDLRHTHATQPLKAGENIKVVSERLGQVFITIVLEIYADVLPDMQVEAARKGDALMCEVMGGVSCKHFANVIVSKILYQAVSSPSEADKISKQIQKLRDKLG